MSESMIDTEEIPIVEPTYWDHESKKWSIKFNINPIKTSLIYSLIRTPPAMSLQNIRPFNDGFNRETLMTYVFTAGCNMLSGKWVTGISLTYYLLIDPEFIHSFIH